MISLLKSRNGLRYYLFRGLALSVLLVCGIFLTGTWQIYRTGLQTLPKEAHADAAVVLGAAAWDKRPSPVFRERINHAITLYQSHRVGKIIFTGGTPKKGFMTKPKWGADTRSSRAYRRTISCLKTRRATLTKTCAISSPSCTPTESAALSLSATRIIWRVPKKWPPIWACQTRSSPPPRPRALTSAARKPSF